VQPYTPRFLHDQAQRTAPTRRVFYQQTVWIDAPICLDIGCGAGAITPEIIEQIPNSAAIGFDIDANLLSEATSSLSNHSTLHYLFADATALPFRSAIVNFAFSHFTLMWIPNRIQAIKEIYNTLTAQGVFACVEPDYTGRIEIPSFGSVIKPKPPFPIVTALTRLGADPLTGGRLPGELAKTGFHSIRFGILSWTFDSKSVNDEIQSEAALLQQKGIEWDVPSFIYTPIFWIHVMKPR
jgi:SAM-dependent methyltransferase